MAVQEHRFDEAGGLVGALGDAIARRLEASLREQSRAVLVVSGGRTPVPLFQDLSRRDLDWSRVSVTLADERWVPADHADSNEALVREHLLRGPAAAASFVPLVNPAPDPFAGEEHCERVLAQLPRPLDVVILGMGDDGHTASLFPKAPQLVRGLDRDSGRLCLGVDPVTAPHLRMSMTLPLLLDSRLLVLHIQGEGKWSVYRQTRQAGPVEQFPIRAVLQQDKVPVHVYWSP